MNYKPIKEVKHKLKDFDCGSEDLNTYLKRFAYQNDKSGIGRTFVLLEGDVLIGYVTLCSASLVFENMPIGIKVPRYPIPAIKIARLAVDKRYHGKGYGKELLAFSLEKVAILSEFIGVRFVTVDTKEESKTFYEHFGFIPLPMKKETYVLPIELVTRLFENN